MLDLHQFLDISYDEFRDAIEKKNRNPDIHGIIIQRPLPDTRTDLMPLLDFIAPEKDIDGFSDASPYEVPVALGVLEILKKIAQRGNTHSLRDFMHNKSVAIIGRGVTAGIPIARMIEKLGSIPAVVHSQTKNPKDVTRGADILISCVGKRKTVTREAIKKGVILIGVGLSRNEDGTYSGDYDEREIEDIASWYTPTPGGVGPVNVASLMKNLVMSYTHSTGGKNL
jgi:methylenetetrahydrofolate dehydrogenase (NADP+)/methenyltetrahydrofolate cyclohydrolase